MELTRHFSRLNKADAGIAGGKGASLGEMTQAGIPVPPGFVVLSGAFERFLQETQLHTEIDTILHRVDHREIGTVERASEDIKALILNAAMPKDIAKDIEKRFKVLNTKYVAVRSSATAEDGKDHAWAGQLESYLNVTEDSVLEKVQHCWASLFTPRAIFYRFEKGLHKTKISVAVVVQKMVESEISGIAFSVHPVTEDYNQLIIEAGFGLGEAIVSGQITPDSYVVEKNPRNILDRNISEQERGLYRVENGGNEWRDIPKEKGVQQKLTDTQILELSEIILKIEKHYGFPCDIEWAYACPERSRGEKGNFYIVQSRPITTLTQKTENSKKKDELGHLTSLQWTKNWEGRFSLLFSLLGIEMSNFQKLLGFGPTHALLFYKEGVTSCYFEDNEMATFGTQLVDMISKQPRLLDAWINTTRSDIDAVRELMRSQSIEKNWSEIKNLLHRYGVYTFIVKELANYLPQELQNSLVPKITEVRKYGETVYFDMSDYISRVLHFIQKKTGVPLEYLECLTPEECGDYFSSGQLPQKDVLTSRRNNCVLFFIPQPIFLNEDQIRATQDYLFKNLDSNELRGQPVFPGHVTARCKVIRKFTPDVDIPQGSILVTGMTDPRYVPLMKKAAAIVTDAGGLLCHAAIVSRELKIPCVVGTKFATEILKDGNLVEVDADRGIVKIISRKLEKDELTDPIRTPLVFEKSITRDWSIIYAEIWHKVFTREFKRQLGWGYTEVIFEGKENAITVYRAPQEHINGMRDFILAQIDKEKSWLSKHASKVKEKVEETISWIKKIEKKKLEDYSPKELAEIFGKFVKMNLELGPRFVMMLWFPIQMEGDERLAQYKVAVDVAIETRTQIEKIGPLVDSFARKIGMEVARRAKIDQTLSRFISSDQIERYLKDNRSPVPEVLLARQDYFIVTNEGILSENIEHYLQKHHYSLYTIDVSNIDIIKGSSAFPGMVRGVVKIIRNKDEFSKLGNGEILVTGMTTPDFLPVMKKSIGFITDEGGVTCHAAIVAREMKKPCIIGTKIATQVLKDGDTVEVDAEKGIVKILKSHTSVDEINWERTVERKQPIYTMTLSFRLYSSMMEKVVGLGYRHLLCLNKRGYGTIYRSAKEVTEANRYVLDIIKNQPERIREWYDVGEEQLQISRKMLEDCNKQGYVPEPFPIFIKKFELIFFHTTILVFFVLHAINSAIEKGERDYYNEAKELFEKLRAQTAYPQIVAEIFPHYFKEAAQKLNVDTKLVELLTCDEFNAVMEGQKVNVDPIGLRKRDDFSAYVFDVDENKFHISLDKNKYQAMLGESMAHAQELHGEIAFKGIARGIARILNAPRDMAGFEEGNILVSINTSPSLMPAIIKSAAIVTDEGGIMCHASIVSRELKKPCIIGTKIATKIIKDGDMVEVDAERGIVKIFRIGSAHINSEESSRAAVERLLAVKWNKLLQRKNTILFLNFIARGEASERKVKEIISEKLVFRHHLFLDDTYYIAEADQRAVDAVIGKKIQEKNFGFFERSLKAWNQAGRKLITYARALSRKSFKDFDNSKLIEYFQTFFEKNRDLSSGLKAPLAIDPFLEDAIRAVLRLKGIKSYKLDEYISVLTAAEDINEAEREYRALLKMAIKTGNKKAHDHTLIDQHIAEYGWMNTARLYGRPWLYEEVQEKIASVQSNAKEKLQEAERKIKLIKSETNKIFSQLMFTTHEKRIVKLAKKYAFFRTLRMDIFLKAGYLCRSLLTEIAERIAISYEDLINLTPEEIVHSLEQGVCVISDKERKDRAENFAFAILPDDQVTILTGSSLDILRRRFAQVFMKDTPVFNQREIRGNVAFAGKVQGTVKKIGSVKDIGKISKGDILVTSMTLPDMMTGIVKAIAIVTDEGGITCHAAIVARELKKPCIIGTKIATQVLKDGDMVEVDAENGVVRIMDIQTRPNSDDYIRMFAQKSFPYLFSNIFLGYYNALDVISIQGDGLWMTFFPKALVKKTNKEGKDLYTSEEKYRKYKAEFDAYIQASREYFKLAIEKKILTGEDVKEFFQYVSKLFVYYSKTEFFYTDGVNPDSMAITVKEFDELKLGGRAYLNSLFFETNGYGKSFVRKISKQAGVDESDLLNYSVSELVDLIENGKKLTTNEMNLRHTFFDSKELVLFGPAAKPLIDKFFSNYLHVSDVIKGTVASKGMAKGKARVLVPDAKDFDKIAKAVGEMKDGEILVAETTSPDIIAACKKAAAIITNQGGQLSHAAIVSRELGIPCIIGTDKDVILNIKTGDELEVDANKGIIRILN